MGGLTSLGWGRNGFRRRSIARGSDRCGGCGTVLNSHYDVRPRLVRDLSCGDQQVFLEVPICRIHCFWFGVKTEELDQLANLPRYTRHFALFVGHLCRESNVDAVAEELGLGWETVKNLDKLYMNELLRLAGSAEPIVIGIDEIAVWQATQIPDHSQRFARSPADLVRRNRSLGSKP